MYNGGAGNSTIFWQTTFLGVKISGISTGNFKESQTRNSQQKESAENKEKVNYDHQCKDKRSLRNL